MDKKTLNNLVGFTLIELMVVIAIIAILATIGFTAYSQAQKIARDGKRIEDIQTAQKSIETYRVATNSLPGWTSGTDLNTTLADTVGGTNITTYFQGGHAPTDPTNSGSYIYKYYTCGTDSTKYAVCAQLESCGSSPNSKCNVSAAPSSACSVTLSPGAGTLQFCVTN